MDTRVVNDRPLTLDCDLDLGHGNLNVKHDTTSHFALSFCKD